MTILNDIAQQVWDSKYAAYKGETYEQGCKRVAEYLGVLSLEPLLKEQKFSVGGRVWYGAGKRKPLLTNCALMDIEDSAEGWATLLYNATLALTAGMGIGVSYDKVRPKGSLINGSGGTASGSTSPMQMLNEIGRHIMQGNTRRSAIYASLHWHHEDVSDFMSLKKWNADYTALKEKDHNYGAPLDNTNVSVRLDQDFLNAYYKYNQSAHKVWDELTYLMFSTSEPGIQFDSDAQILRNACTEVISEHNLDTCQLGSLNLATIKDLDELEETVKWGMLALLKARRLSYYPISGMKDVAFSHPRVGLGIMGLHNWFIQRGKPYKWDALLETWLKVIKEASVYWGEVWCNKYGYRPLEGHTAIAPTGSISRLFNGVSSGIEPIFALATKWRYTLDNVYQTKVVIDQNVFEFLKQGVDVTKIQDAYTLSSSFDGFRDRVQLQANVQQYIDNAISSTINLPMWGSEHNNEQTLPKYKSIILDFLPKLRGLTVYADGSRSGQPLTAIPIEQALEEHYSKGSEYAQCASGVCGM